MRNTLRSFTNARYALALLALPVLVPTVQGQETLPEARDLVSRYVTAIGGRDAFMSRPAVNARGVFEMPAVGLRGDFAAAHAKSGEMLMKVTVPGIGEIVNGYDGKVAWATNPMTGPRVLSGEELRQVRDDADFLASLREAPVVSSLETVGMGDMDGERCYRVRVIWASGRTTHDCYSVESGLLVGTEASQPSPMGTLDVTTVLSEYKDFGGVQMATLATIRQAGQDQVLRFVSIDFEPIPKEVFAPPADVAAMIAREKEASPGK